MSTNIARKKNVVMIPAKPEFDRRIKVEHKKIKVAAYCRVSTTLEQQESSFEAQISYYTEKINSTEDWKMAGIYADDGKSATSTVKRDNFNTMIEDCMKGKIDLVLTKSISRFARNTVDFLENIRKLKAKNIGIFFEKEGINTLESTGELLVTILSSQAQEESRNLSENTRWGIIRRFEEGIVSVNHTKFLGYTKDTNGELIIVPKEAEIVKKIFRLYLEGNSCNQIAKELSAEGIRTVTGNAKWQASVIDRMLINEKYKGDVLLQKTYTVDYLTKKKVKNINHAHKYYIDDNHEAIIPKELYNKVQEEKARRAMIHRPSTAKKKGEVKSKYSSKYALSDIMICKECGHPYRRQVWVNQGEKTAVWRCNNRLKNGTKNCKHSPTLKETALNESIMTAINNVVEDQGEFIEDFRENVIRVIGSYSTKNVVTEYDDEIEQLQKQMLTLIQDNAKQGIVAEDFDKYYQDIGEQIKELKLKKIILVKEKILADSYSQRLETMEVCMKKTSCKIVRFDEELVRRLLQTIRVIKENKIEIQFQSGIVMEQRIDDN